MDSVEQPSYVTSSDCYCAFYSILCHVFNLSLSPPLSFTSLSKKDGSPWTVSDWRSGRTDLSYDLQVCRRLQDYKGNECNGTAAACQRIIESDKSLTYKNMGLPEGEEIELNLIADFGSFQLKIYLN